MKFAVITHVIHKKLDKKFLAYAPYVLEMNRWFKNVDEVKIVAPLEGNQSSKIAVAYEASQLELKKIPRFSLISVAAIFKTIFRLPLLCWEIIKAMTWADHIHLRCPGNMGLLGCIMQIFFPSKPKTVKYAGNWDPASKQPWSYRLQKWITSSTFLSKNIKVLVYGDWPKQTKNIKSFFTASFSETEIVKTEYKEIDGKIVFIFVGSLVEGKQPLYAIKVVESLNKGGVNAFLNLYGEGPLKESLELYIKENNLSTFVQIWGGIPLKYLKQEYKNAHFSILPSKSEGWPKAVAEAMFFNCVPIATAVSCVPWMLNYGKRGVILNQNFEENISNITRVIENPLAYKAMAKDAGQWSQKYTLEYFESEIRKLL
ncbi:glycosyltransferase family 4 protein [Zunongwangia endophytica]|uniref:Glycosyltransferase family 4 protein n=1 Tax=Zunongwangia endophytica TaxID=1808945 RepID=A0ABV8H972_9FLAO|nr:glycosyltransferase [Zunongwangia endophytica]MDN3595025.1 glycosyltransferase [Zunongwangia endophytica]